jgi:hypothetical protein
MSDSAQGLTPDESLRAAAEVSADLRERRRRAAASARLNRRLGKFYASIGVDPALLAVQPPVAPRLAAVRAIISRVYPAQADSLPLDPLVLLRHSADPDALLLLNIFARIDDTRIRDHVPIEAIALAAGVPMPRVVDMLMASLCRMSHEVATMVTAFGHIQVVEDTLASARVLGPDGDAARSMVHKAVGWLPTPKGSVTNISLAAHANANPQTAIVAAPSPEATVRQLSEKFNAERTLSPPPLLPTLPESDIEDAEFTEDDE